MFHERQFRAMNTQIAVLAWSEEPDERIEAALAQAPDFFELAEQELSRFREHSGLCRLNAGAGLGAQPVSGTLRAACEQALKAAAATDGLFDPTILPALKQMGYDVSFERIAPSQARPGATATKPAWREIQITKDTISLPAGSALDLGGMAKGFTVDRVAERLKGLGPVLVDAGGDIRVFGAPDGSPWEIAVPNPFKEHENLVVLGLKDEAIATSTIGYRKWQRGGEAMHHLIDPRSQKPSASDLHTVTVIGPSAMESEIHAKVALLLGAEEGRRHLEARGLNGILVRRDASVVIAGTRVKPRVKA